MALLAAALLLFLAVPAYSQAATPLMRAVDPLSGVVGDVFVVQGDNLDKANVADLYLTDGKNDIKIAMTEQSATSIKFKLPPAAKVGHFALMVLTVGKNARYIEQPVKITVEPAAKPAT
jgi:hypothetical protein